MRSGDRGRAPGPRLRGGRAPAPIRPAIVRRPAPSSAAAIRAARRSWPRERRQPPTSFAEGPLGSTCVTTTPVDAPVAFAMGASAPAPRRRDLPNCARRLADSRSASASTTAPGTTASWCPSATTIPANRASVVKTNEPGVSSVPLASAQIGCGHSGLLMGSATRRRPAGAPARWSSHR